MTEIKKVELLVKNSWIKLYSVVFPFLLHNLSYFVDVRDF